MRDLTYPAEISGGPSEIFLRRQSSTSKPSQSREQTPENNPETKRNN